MLCGIALGTLCGCSDTARLPPGASEGPYPQLPAPTTHLIPTVHIAPAKGWPDGKTPIPAAGLHVDAFATGLNQPRWLLVLPNGDVLVAGTNAPERPDDGAGIKAQVQKRLMKDAGATVPSANRIVLLRDADGDGAAEQRTPFIEGLNSPFGMAWELTTAALWTVVNERDELGSDLVPDCLTSVTDGAFYGWPHSYYGRHVDDRVEPRPDLMARARVPDYALGNHVAPLGLVSLNGSRLPAPFVDGMVMGEHGSWNRKPRNGYKVVFVPFANGRPQGKPIDVLTGFISPDGEAWGRPVGVAVDRRCALLVADDVGNTVWRVSVP